MMSLRPMITSLKKIMIVIDNAVPNKEINTKCTVQEQLDGEISEETKNRNKLLKTKNF